MHVDRKLRKENPGLLLCFSGQFPISMAAIQHEYPPPFTNYEFCYDGDSSNDDDYSPMEELDDEEEDEAAAYFDDEDGDSPSLAGSDEEYKCESDTESETAPSAAKRKSRSTKSNNPNKKNKSSSSGRVWKEKDEIILLEGLISNFSKNKGIYEPRKFFTEIVKSLPDMSLSQVRDKVRRLKNKFTNLKASKTNPIFAKSESHEKILFDLSKRAWGNPVVLHFSLC